MHDHDARCEAWWNDGICACQDRLDNVPFWKPRPATARFSIVRLIIGFVRRQGGTS